jgi:hypothetical protein
VFLPFSENDRFQTALSVDTNGPTGRGSFHIVLRFPALVARRESQTIKLARTPNGTPYVALKIREEMLMRGTRRQRHRRATGGSFTRSLARTKLVAPQQEPQPARADNPTDRKAEEDISSWEMAWIDLGGEG